MENNSSSERRRYQRVEAQLLLGTKPLDGEVFVGTKSKNISEAGIKVVLKESLSRGKVLHIKLIYPPDCEIVEVLARVVWSKKNKENEYDIGIETINCATIYPYLIKKFKKSK